MSISMDVFETKSYMNILCDYDSELDTMRKLLKPQQEYLSPNENRVFLREATGAEETGTESRSRHEIIEELKILGVDTERLSALSIEGLVSLLNSIRDLMAASVERKKPGRPRNNPESVPILTNSDRIIVQRLIQSEGHVSSLSISKELNIPLSTIQRRRKRLEEILIQRNYSLKIELLGWRKATLYASLIGGQSELVGKQILDMSKRVTSVTRTLGNSGLDLQIKVLFKANSELTSLIEQIKSIEGISGVTWCESLSTIGKNPEVYKQVID